MPLIQGDPIVLSHLNGLFTPIAGTIYPTAGAVQVAHTQNAIAPRLLDWAYGAIGTSLPGHTASESKPSSVATPVTKTAISGTLAVNGATGWTIQSTQFLRVRWSVQCRPRYTGTPWVGAYGEILIEDSGGAGTVQTAYNGNCWLLELQYASNAALTVWNTMPGQSNYSTALVGSNAGLLSESIAVAVVPAWHVFSTQAVQGEIPASLDQPVRWITAEGEYIHDPAAPILIYGLRVVVHGLYHMYQDATPANVLILDMAAGGANQHLLVDCASITAEWYLG